MLDAGTAFAARIVERYRDRKAIVAWQVEHDAVDPLGMEHSWRLSATFVRREVEAVRAADPTRPVMMNGFLPTSAPVRIQQWWRTRGRAIRWRSRNNWPTSSVLTSTRARAGQPLPGRTVYLAGSAGSVAAAAARRLLDQMAKTDAKTGGARAGQRVMIAEGQAEPWEAVTTPPSPAGRAMYSLPPEDLIGNYNQCMRWTDREAVAADGHLFWGAEYWLLRKRQGDHSYLDAFGRILENA